MIRNLQISLVICAVLLFPGCSIKSSYKVRSFFFDGVPNPYAEIVKDTVVIIDSLTINNVVAKKKKVEFEGSKHQPFLERKCVGCHNPSKSRALNSSDNLLCFDCHKNFNDSYEYNHAPAATGSCTICHNPHESKLDFLLKKEGQELCLYCHDTKDIVSNTFHSDIEDSNCTKCHNPHGGANNMLMKKGACYECHDNFDNGSKIVHGPVDAGSCYVCHTTHSGKKETHLLVRSGNNLCLNCHTKEDVFQKSYHKTQKMKSCTNCHDAHGSEHNYLLKTVELVK